MSLQKFNLSDSTHTGKRIIRGFAKTLFVLLVVHFLIEATGNHHLYNTLASTVFQGRLGPEIEEYKGMVNAELEVGTPEPWPIAKSYGQIQLSESEEAYHQEWQSVSFVVIHKDSLLFEQYWEDFGPDTISNSFSMAKSVVGVLAGIAIDEGYFSGVEEPIYKRMAQYGDSLGRKISVKHLLTMSSGIDFDENYLNPFAFPAKANYGDNLELLVSNYHPAYEPGVYFDYQSGTTQVLAEYLTKCIKRPLSEYASDKLWSEIGAENPALWSLDHEDGEEKAFCCINATARDFARIGKLYKDHGKWNGKQIVDSAYVAASVSYPGLQEREDDSECKRYGYSWWLGEHKNMDFFFMRGIKGQYVLVVPEKDLIVVRMGRKRDVGKNWPHPDDVYNYLDMGLKMIE